MPEPTCRNPVLPGFAADPSICRVGRDHYLVNSSFELFPGLPIHHSRDLVHWRLIGHAVARERALPLAGRGSSRGLFAPTLRHGAGRFWIACTDVDGGGGFLLHAHHAAGPWSDPVWLPEPTFGMDPSLFFDDDGTVYYTRHGGGERGAVYQAVIDLDAGRLLGPARPIWRGTGGIWPEGPHLFKRRGWYYLLLAEGGTSYGHAVTMARARSPWGPFEPHPGNPVLTHRDHPDEPLQALGHADLLLGDGAHDWAVLLGVRPQEVEGVRHHHLGRETLLAPVRWRDDGWPVFNEGRPLAPDIPSAGLPPLRPWPEPDVLERFEPAPSLPLHWQRLRGEASGRWSLHARPGWLRLQPGEAGLADIGTPALLLRPQRHAAMRLETELAFDPRAPGDAAGLALRQSEAHHATVQVGWAGERVVQLRQRAGGPGLLRATQPLPPGLVTLRVDATPAHYRFAWRAGAGDWQPLGELPTAALSTETAGGFLGVHLGPFAEASRLRPVADAPPADFAWIRLEPGRV